VAEEHKPARFLLDGKPFIPMAYQKHPELLDPVPVPEVAKTTPQYPPAARSEQKMWLASGGRRSVGVVVMTLTHDGDCRSCGGEGAVHMRMLANGPEDSPLTMMKPSTYIEDEFRPGWWVIEETKSWSCPRCAGRGREPGVRNGSGLEA
jgi:hypothetical protein